MLTTETRIILLQPVCISEISLKALSLEIQRSKCSNQILREKKNLKIGNVINIPEVEYI